MTDARCRLRFVIAPAGGHAYAVAALDLDGRCDLADHLQALHRTDRSAAAKVLQMLDRLALHGTGAFKKDKTQFRSDLGDALFELKPGDHRLLFFQSGQTWIVVSAGMKPKGQKKVQDAMIQEGKRRKALYLRLLNEGKIDTL